MVKSIYIIMVCLGGKKKSLLEAVISEPENIFFFLSQAFFPMLLLFLTL